MRSIEFYNLNCLIDTCGHFFLIRDPEENPSSEEMCRIHVGTAGPASLVLSAEKMSFLYLGDPLHKERIVQAVSWTSGEDGIRRADAIAFLKEHRIPWKTNRIHASAKKPGKYVWGENGYLGDKGLLKLSISKSYIRGDRSDYLFSDWYLAPEQVKKSKESAQYVKYFNCVKEVNHDLAEKSFLDVFENADAASECMLEEILQKLPVHIENFECENYRIFSQNRQENFVSSGNCGDSGQNYVLSLSGWFKNCKELFLAYSGTSFLTVPCRIMLCGVKGNVELPWEADLNNTYLIFRDAAEDTYLFEKIPFVQREDGSCGFCPQELLKEHGIQLEIRTKAECRKQQKDLEKHKEFISAAPCGFCYEDTYQAAWYTKGITLRRQYLKDCSICGHKILEIRSFKDSEYINLLNYDFGLLFQWHGEISEERLLTEGEHFLTLPGIRFETDAGTLDLDCPQKRASGLLRETLCFRRGAEVIWQLDVTDRDWKEKAAVLAAKLRSM